MLTLSTSTLGAGAMAAIGAAVTPVVMISANAILVGAISSKHQGMADRMRALTAEWRLPGTTPERRATIREQIIVFEARMRWISRAHCVLYVSTACFLAMVISIAVSTAHQTWFLVSFPLLIGGVGLTFAAIVLELMDLGKAHETILLESQDVVAGQSDRSLTKHG